MRRTRTRENRDFLQWTRAKKQGQNRAKKRPFLGANHGSICLAFALLAPARNLDRSDVLWGSQVLPGGARDEPVPLGLGDAQSSAANLVLRPVEAPLLQTSAAQPQASAVVHQNLDAGGTPVGKDVSTVQACAAFDVLHHTSQQGVHACTQVTSFSKEGHGLWGFTVSFLKDGVSAADVRVSFDEEVTHKHEWVGRAAGLLPSEHLTPLVLLLL